MTLQEILKSLNLSDEQIAQVNTAVDAVIDSKTSPLNEQITGLQGDLDTANGALAPYKEQEQKSKLSGLMPEEAHPDRHEDIVKLSGIEDGDDDETIKSKLSDTVSSRDYLQNKPTEDPAVEKTQTQKPEVKPKENKEDKEDDGLSNL